MNHSMPTATAQVVAIADLEKRFNEMLVANNWIDPHEMNPYWDSLSVADLQLAAMYFTAKADMKQVQSVLAVA